MYHYIFMRSELFYSNNFPSFPELSDVMVIFALELIILVVITISFLKPCLYMLLSYLLRKDLLLVNSLYVVSVVFTLLHYVII